MQTETLKEYFVIHGDKVKEITESKGKCDFCGRNYKSINVVESDTDHGTFRACEICMSIVLYERIKAYRTIYLKSKLSQQDIVKKTAEHYFHNGSVPSPNQLDSHAKLLDMSSPNLKQWRCYNGKVNKRVLKKGIVAFVNPEFILDKVLVRNFCAVTKPNKTYWDDISKLKKYEIREKIESYMKGIFIDGKERSIIKESKENLERKVKHAERMVKLGV